MCVTVRVNGMQDCSDDLLVYLSHATQERLRDVIEKMTEISRHRVEVLKVSFSSIVCVCVCAIFFFFLGGRGEGLHMCKRTSRGKYFN